MPHLPLSRLKVIDLTRARAGPTCVRQLADWGAEVVKVEAAEGDATGMGADRNGPDFQNLHRNKRSITLNLKKPEGVAVLKALVKDADVLVENFRADVKFRLGIDYETLKPLNKRLVYASISGFGQTGPYRDRPGVDQIAQGMGGLMSITGLPGQGPVRVGIAICDLTAGIFTAMGILIAILEREESGEGQFVETSLLSAIIAMLDFQAARWTLAKDVPGQAGNNHPTNIPSGVFRTKDGHINIAAAVNEMFQRFCKAAGIESLLDNADFANGKARLKNRDKLNAIIDEVTATRSSDDWVIALNKAGVPTGPIYRMDQVFADPQVQHLGIVQPVESKKLGLQELIGQAVTLSRTPSKLRSATPERGEHTDEVLGELGYDAATIARFHSDGVV
jgi:formyl-CoA transferase